ncbi:MAG: helix-turn-helix domain-containing protein [Rhodobacteraceae bacterium]|nr:helix-turn-helix domain-containing protein [Paracoccaceae bacterium]
MSQPEIRQESVQRPYLTAAFLLCPNFTLTPMACFSDALRLAADHHDNSRQVFFKWEYASASLQTPVSSSGLTVAPTISLAEAADFDCIVVCGGLIRGFETLRPEVLDLLRAAHAKSKLIVGLCTGSFVLAQAGLLQGKSSAIQANVLQDFVRMFPDTTPLTRKNYWVEDNLITCPGGILSLDVAAHLIRTWGDASRTFKALDYLLFDYENPRTRFPERPYQSQLDRASDLTRNAVSIMENHVDTPFTVSELANRLACTRARLNRVFAKDMGAAPGSFWMEMRLNLASRSLIERNHSVTEVGYTLGFSDTAHFCKNFKAKFDLSPNAFRKRYRSATEGSPVSSS